MMILFETKEVMLSCVPQWPSTRLKHNPESTLKPLSLLAGKKLKFTKTLKMSHNSHILGNHFKTWVKREQRIPTNHVKRKRWGYKWHHEFSTVSSLQCFFKTQIHSNMTDTLSNNLTIARLLHLFICDFICKKPKMNNKIFTQATLEYTKYTLPNIYQLPQLAVSVMSHIPPHLVLQFSLQFHMTLLPSLVITHIRQPFWMPTSTRKV